MESMEKIPKSEDGNEMAAFQSEMRELKAKEESGELKTAHFQELNPNELTDEDREIWEKLQSKELSTEEFSMYRTKVSRGRNASQKHFVGFIGNKLMIQMFEDKRQDGK